jgi:hypothetical protein
LSDKEFFTMAAMSTVLTQFANNGNSLTYTLPVHTAVKPALVLQRRKVPSGAQTVVEDTITVLYATADPDGAILPQRSSMSVTIRRPLDGEAAIVTSLLALFREVVASDNFANTVSTQEWLQ